MANCAAHPSYHHPQSRTDAVHSCWDQSRRSQPSSTHHMARSSAFVFSAYLSAPQLLTVMWIQEGGRDKTSPTSNRKKKIKKFPFHMLSQNTENILKKHPNLLRKKNQEIGAVRDVESSSVSKQCGQLGQCSLCSRYRRRHTSGQKTTLPTVLAGFQFHCVTKSRYFPL